jgi:hypothetical protein
MPRLPTMLDIHSALTFSLRHKPGEFKRLYRESARGRYRQPRSANGRPETILPEIYRINIGQCATGIANMRII